MTRAQAREIVLAAAGKLNDGRAEKIEVARGDETPLYGRDGVLDSMGLVALVVAVEQEVEERLQIGVILADEKAMSLSHNPFRTVGVFAEYLQQRCQEAAGAP
jgi:acyl carrier protein